MKKLNTQTHIVFYIVSNFFMLLYPLFNELIFTCAFSYSLSFYKILFSLSSGLFLVVLGSLFKRKKTAFILQCIFCLITSIIYITQHIYCVIFSTPYVLSSLKGIVDAFEFKDVAMNAIAKNWYVYALYVLLIVLLFTVYRFLFLKSKVFLRQKLVLIFVWAVFFASSICLPITSSSGIGSARYLMLNEYIPVSSVKTFGVPFSMALDLRYKFFDQLAYTPVIKPIDPNTSNSDNTSSNDSSSSEPAPNTPVEPAVVYEPQVLDINFNLSETNKTYLEMNNFFSNKTPTMENEYTGMFEGKNLILITAEAFSDKLIDPVLTPTLYKLKTEGFNFKNFYTPIWGVSTSDGEFVATTGLLPKAGIWSYTKIAENYMPFAFGNQFNSLGYNSYAFHNHTYTYYNRHLSYPTMGYDYYGKGKGLTSIKSVWPESDVEMAKEATPMFVNDENFHVYMLTVSGHLEYTFMGNMMATKHKSEVEDLDYSNSVRAYIACNLELEYAMASLLEQLEQAGQLENTVIALSADHYPYGLEVSEYAELYHKKSIDETFELYENGFLLWNSEMEKPINIDKYCSSLDIAPTLSNLFGLDYDSRLYIGKDILSDSEALVMFLDRSFITDKYMYNANTGKATSFTGENISSDDIEIKAHEVSQLFRYSGKIIENDYYGYLLK